MNFITKQAFNFAEENLMYGPGQYERIINETRNHVADIDDPLDKIKFLNTVLEYNSTLQKKHSIECKNPEGCQKDFGYQSITYYLTQELTRLGVKLKSDAFTTEEKENTNIKIDEILTELSSVKAGQQVIYEELQNELNELRGLFFLGKKNWFELLLGKGTEMVASGIISATVSTQIIHTVKTSFPQLLNP